MQSSIPLITVVGDHSPDVLSHLRIPVLLDLIRTRHRQPLDARWLATEDALRPGALDGSDGIWLVPVGADHKVDGAVDSARIAREQKIPFLGTCSGFQYGLLEFARNVCGLPHATHAEHEQGDAQVIVPLNCSEFDRTGEVTLAANSLAARLMGEHRVKVRYRCNYGPNEVYLPLLRRYGMALVGFDDEQQLRVAELPEHPFYLLTLFQPELSGPWPDPHPLIQGFITTAVRHAYA